MDKIERQQRVISDNTEDINKWTYHVEDLLQQNRSAVDDFLTKELQKDVPTGEAQLFT